MFTEIPLFPEQGSTFAERVDTLFFFLLGLATFFTLLITTFLVIFVIRYRRRPMPAPPPPIRSSLALELTWTLIPLAITLVVFVWGAQLHYESAQSPNDALEVYVVGKQWMWKMQHVGGQREINELHVPVGRPVKVTLISQDVIHSFFVPAFRIHQDVLPNRYTSIWFEATKPGRYHLFCSQYCGTDHAKMVGSIIAMPAEEFAHWLQQGPDGSMASEGRKLFQKFQCVACHSANAGGRAPVLEGLFGRDVELRNGRRVRADEAYLRESIVNPDAKVVAGFESIMPSYAGQIDEEEMLRLLAFLRGLGPGETPRRTEGAAPPQIRREP